MPANRLELITIGTELLLGFTLDTNAAFLGQQLSAAGVQIIRRTSVVDTPAEIRAAVDEALTRTGAVLTTGGLGPTRDDMTRNVVADLLGLPLVFNDDVWEMVLARYRRFGRAPAESNRSQAMVPAGATWLRNEWGTAPGLWIDSPRGLIIMLPGVPLEMRKLMEHEVLPRLRARGSDTVVRSVTLRTTGIPESTLAERIGEHEDAIAPLSLAYLPGLTGVDLRVTAFHLAPDDAAARLHDAVTRLRSTAGAWIYGENDDDLAAIVLGELRAAGATLAVAESCTGGLLGGRITAVPGASDVFVGGAIAYANDIKQRVLGVDPALVAEHGAVSSEVAAAMARGAAQAFGASVVVSVTGIAGPGGGSADKPVGTVWFGLYRDGVVTTHRSVFGGERAEIRERAVQGALLGVWRGW
ncbi:MAG TPA: competence/damage-inducible protein A [Gemmatimonadales bacterium]|jgi:nicotinamide-nucleotide amidase